MSGFSGPSGRPRLPARVRPGPAVKVAAAATALLAVVSVIAVLALNLIVSAHLNGETRARLSDRLSDVGHDPARISRLSGGGGDPRDSQEADPPFIYVWMARADGTVIARSPGAPPLPAAPFRAGAAHDGLFLSAALGPRSTPFQLLTARAGDRWVVAGQNVADDTRTRNLLRDAEIATEPFMLTAMFLVLLIVGRRSLAPVERSRQRQLEFTADASHELRTPVAVIRAEVDVALSSPRDAAGYRDALTRVQGETGRLRQLVDDMLWLARFDSRPPPPGNEPVDLSTVAAACADRFRSVGPALTSDAPADPVLISAPPEWIDRLAGVLMDNACRYAGPAGQVRIRVLGAGNRASLVVEDSGPGIPAADRDRLFDRFRRAAERGPGAGLGLAIGDSIVRSTGGRWQVGESGLGGALMSVSWRSGAGERRRRPPARSPRLPR